MAPPSNHDDAEDSNQSKSVAVVGAGVSGLAAAHKLKSVGINVTVFEAEDRAGGSIRTVSQNGMIWDEGANTMTESDDEVKALIENLGLWREKQRPASQNQRYIVRDGRPVMIPTNIVSFLTSNFLSFQSKLRLLMEPFEEAPVSEDSSDNSNESVGDFFERRFGKEVVDYLVDPFVAGTSGGDPESLSARLTFPDLRKLEKKFGSIIGGLIRSKFFKNDEEQPAPKVSSDRPGLRGSFSFYDGMQTLTDKLCENLGADNLKLSSKVLSLSYSVDEKNPLSNWSVGYAPNNQRKRLEQSFDAVIMTAPICKLKDMRVAKGGKRFSFDFLPRITYLPISVIVTSFKQDDVKNPLRGFGVLVPSKEQENGFQTLGTLFSSMMFPDRAPYNQYLYTTFIGGSRNRELAGAPLDKLMPIVKSDLKRLLGVEGEPTFVKHVHWPNAFPLYGRDYDSVLEAINKLEQSLPGLFYAGNHRGGLSVGKAITSGLQAAEHVNLYLNATISSSSEATRDEDSDTEL